MRNMSGFRGDCDVAEFMKWKEVNSTKKWN